MRKCTRKIFEGNDLVTVLERVSGWGGEYKWVEEAEAAHPGNRCWRPYSEQVLTWIP